MERSLHDRLVNELKRETADSASGVETDSERKFEQEEISLIVESLSVLRAEFYGKINVARSREQQHQQQQQPNLELEAARQANNFQN